MEREETRKETMISFNRDFVVIGWNGPETEYT